MATGVANRTDLANSADAGGERVIHSQLRRAGRYVKWVEAGSQLLTLVIGTLVFFLVAALIDHWIVSLGWFGRWVLCLAFLGGCGWFIVARLLPLFIRRVNPTYSARAIEEAQPTLKNSLVNFLLLKDDRTAVKQSVLHALEQRAATDISTVEVETAIDRAPLIRVGYVLCGVMAVAALYKIASPKDPFQTAARVVAPWSDIARPSRVLIREVQPGHTAVYLGSTVEVIADVQGVRGQDQVRLIYSSADGQVLDRAIVMKNSGGGHRYVATLPPADEAAGSSAGLQQGVQYHVAAGDAVSSIYEIRVRMAPTISVERAELAFPAYTQKPPQTQPTGEIKALEGTRVTIHARANQPIKSAVLEFDPRVGRTGERIPLQVDGQSARGSFTLQLKSDRVTPWRESYQVRFTNELDEISEQPVIHRLEVTPDLPPEVEILQPRSQKIDLPADGRLTIEARGVDPDFALFDLHVAGKLQGQELFRKSLLPPGELRAQATGKFEFVPAEYDLKAGAVVVYQAVASDNRRDPVTGQPQPGRAQTAEYVVQIVTPQKPNEVQNPNAPRNDAQEQPDPNNANPQPMQKPSENRPKDRTENNPAENKPPMPGEQQPPMPAEGEPQPNGGEQKNDAQPPAENTKPQKPQDQPKTGNQQNGENNSGQSGNGQGESTKGQGNQAQPGNGSGQSNNNSQPNDQRPMPGSSQGSEGGQGSQNGGTENQPGEGGQPTAGGDQNNSGNPAGANQSPADNQGGTGDPSGNGSLRSGESGGQQGGKKPEHDGEKFEKLLEHLKRELEENKKGGSKGQNPGEQSPANSPSNNEHKQPGSGQSGQPGNQQPPDNKAGEQLLKDLEQYLKEKQAQEAKSGKAPDKNDQAVQQHGQPDGQPMNQPGSPDAGKPEARKPQPRPRGDQPGSQQNGNPPGGQPQRSNGQQPMGTEPMPGQGGTPQNGAGQQPNKTEGGSPQGTPRTDEGKQPSKPGEQKQPGAGQNGDPGAGDQSQDPNGSGLGQEQNRDKPKEMQPGEGSAPKGNEASSPSTSKNQSDSKGGASGDQSGGGKQGSGQTGGQQGNDSAGGSSPGDEGAGRANEQGKGETGNKAGKGREAAGKTGQPGGQKPGDGTATKPGEKGSESGKGGQPGKQPGQQGEQEPGGSTGGGSQPGPGSPAGGGSGGDRSGQGITNRSADAADEANLNYTRKATDLVLQYLRDQEHNPDPDLAQRSGMSPADIQEFTRRWNQLKKEAEADPAKARELDEALRALGMRDPKNRRRSGGTVTDKQRDLRDAGGRTQAPPKYREQFDQFRKSSGLLK